MCLNNLASLLTAKGDYAAAELLLRRAMAIDEKAWGPDHPQLAIHLNNLASLFVAKGDYAATEPLFRRALAIDEKALGPDHRTTQQVRKNLDDLLRLPKPLRRKRKTEPFRPTAADRAVAEATVMRCAIRLDGAFSFSLTPFNGRMSKSGGGLTLEG